MSKKDNDNNGNVNQNGNFKLYTANQAADLLMVKEAYIKRMCREDKLKGIKIGKFWRVTEAEINEFINNQEQGYGGNCGVSKDAKDRIQYQAIYRSVAAPNRIEQLHQDIDKLKAAIQIDVQLKELTITAKLIIQVMERETMKMRLDQIPEVLNKLADSAYPGMKELLNEDPEALEVLFAAEVNGTDQPQAENAVAHDIPMVAPGLDD